MSAAGLLAAALKILGGAQVLLCFGLLAVWLLRALRAPGRMICVLMTVLLAGAFLPAGVQSAASLFNVSWIADISGMHAAPFSCSWVQIVSNSLAENGFPVQTAAAQTGVRGIFESLRGSVLNAVCAFGTPLACVWLMGIAALWVYSAVGEMRLRARVRQAVLLQPGVFEAPSDMPALTMGFIRPRIYLPATLDARQRLHVLLHEKAHARWRDPLMRLLSFLAISVFWFSPIVWLYGLVLQNQMERACDEAALHGLGRQSAADYCQTLLNLASRSGIGAGCAPFGKSAVKERICTALRYREAGTRRRLFTGALCLILLLCLLTCACAQTTTLRAASGQIDYAVGSATQTLSVQVSLWTSQGEQKGKLLAQYPRADFDWIGQKGTIRTELTPMTDAAGNINRVWAQITLEGKTSRTIWGVFNLDQEGLAACTRMEAEGILTLRAGVPQPVAALIVLPDGQSAPPDLSVWSHPQPWPMAQTQGAAVVVTVGDSLPLQ